MKRLAELVVKFRVSVIAAVAILTVFMVFGLVR